MIRRRALSDAGKEVRCGREHGKVARFGSDLACGRGEDADCGGFAFAREYDIERKWREVRIYQTASICTNLILAYIGHLLGMLRSY